MWKLPLVGLVAVVATGCYREYGSDSTMPPPAPEPVTVYGPPGGAADPGYGYEAPGQPGYPAGYAPGYPEGYPAGTEYGAADPGAASADTQPVVDATAPVTDTEIDQTLAPYGEWVVVEDYGRVWRPYTTVVGVNFTPYETCGTWVYTEYGWTFTCDWDWGWLPFHYGNWLWLDGYWGWCPGYAWSPAWVEWRYGGGYVGWRPLGPRIRDHRDRHKGPIIRDHRRRESDWRFTTVANFGKRNLHAQTHTNLADALDKTTIVTRPPVRNPITVSVKDSMRGRLGGRVLQDPTRGRGSRGFDPQPPRGSIYQPPARTPHGSTYRPPYGANPTPPATYQPPRGSTYQPPATYQPPRGSTYQPPRGTNQPPTYQPPRGSTYQPPRGTYQPPTYQPPRGSTYQPPRGSTYQPPTYTPPSRGTYNPPARSTYSPPSRSTYSPPSRSTYSPPSRSTYSPPSRSSYSPPSRSSYSPSRSSSSSSHSSSSSRSSSHSSSGRRR